MKKMMIGVNGHDSSVGIIKSNGSFFKMNSFDNFYDALNYAFAMVSESNGAADMKIIDVEQ